MGIYAQQIRVGRSNCYSDPLPVRATISFELEAKIRRRRVRYPAGLLHSTRDQGIHDFDADNRLPGR